MDKYIDQKRQVDNNCIDYKKAFARVWHEGLWHVISSFGIGNDIIQCIKSLYNSSKSSVGAVSYCMKINHDKCKHYCQWRRSNTNDLYVR